MNSMEIRKIGFIGMGLIGGSLAKAIKKYHPAAKIIAKASERTIKEAFLLGICENKTPTDMSDFSDVNIIFLCCPVEVNIMYLEILKEHLKNDMIVTDVGSVKGDIHAAVDRLNLNDFFVGGHPMAGSEKSGLKNSHEDILKDCRYCLTTFDGKSNKNSRALASFLHPLKVRTRLLSYKEHDLSAAGISHIPHITSSVLCNMVSSLDDYGAMFDMASSGFKDSTRIAKGNPDLWLQIIKSNKNSIQTMLNEYEKYLDEFKYALSNDDFNKIFSILNSAKKYRDRFDG